MPSARAVRSSSSIRAVAAVSSNAATISRMQSAPSARDSKTWYGSITKSLRSTGSVQAARAARR